MDATRTPRREAALQPQQHTRRRSSISLFMPSASKHTRTLALLLSSAKRRHETQVDNNNNSMDIDNNKENSPTQEVEKQAYDALLGSSPSKPALTAAYPVLSPFKRGLQPSPLKHSSTRTSIFRQVSLSPKRATSQQEPDVSMSSATASVLDDLMVELDSDQPHVQERQQPAQEDAGDDTDDGDDDELEVSQYLIARRESLLPTPALEEPSDEEILASRGELAKHDQTDEVLATDVQAPVQPQHDTCMDESTATDHDVSMTSSYEATEGEDICLTEKDKGAEQVCLELEAGKHDCTDEGMLSDCSGSLEESLDATELAAQIPLPASPEKAIQSGARQSVNAATLFPTVESTATSPKLQLEDITELAANVPLPASPEKAPQQPVNVASSVSTARLATPSTPPVEDITALAASVPIPPTPAPAVASSVSLPYASAREDPTTNTLEDASFAASETPSMNNQRDASLVASPLSFKQSEESNGKKPSPEDTGDVSFADAQVFTNQETLHQEANVFEQEELLQHASVMPSQDAPWKDSLPFAAEESVPSPVKQTVTFESLDASLKEMPYSRSHRVDSPVKMAKVDRQGQAPVASALPSAPVSPLREDWTGPASQVSSADVHLVELLKAAEPADIVTEAAADKSSATPARAGVKRQRDMEETQPSGLMPSTPMQEGASAQAPFAKRRTLARQAAISEQSIFENSISQAPHSVVKTVPQDCASIESLSQTAEMVVEAAAQVSATDVEMSSDTSSSTQQAMEVAKHAESPSLGSSVGDSSARPGAEQKQTSEDESSVSPASPSNALTSEQSDIQPTRRITRQRSLTLLQVVQKASEPEEPSPSPQEPIVPEIAQTETNVQATPEVRGRKITLKAAAPKQPDSAEVRMATKGSAATGRRKSTRIAATSALPQPKSRIAKRSASASLSDATASAAADTAAPPTKKARTNSATASKDGPSFAQTPKAESDEEEKAIAVTSRVAEPARRVQRSARPARQQLTAEASAKPLPSPGRVPSPVKKPLKAGRKEESSQPAAFSLYGDAAQHRGSGPTKVQLRSSSRILSPARGAAGPMRSPSRVLPYQTSRSPQPGMIPAFDWANAPPQDIPHIASGPSKPLSPSAYRKVASRIFAKPSTSNSAASLASGSSGPASSGIAASGSLGPASPIKGLAQRFATPASPTLLGISVAPELLVLAPPSPRVPSPLEIDHDIPQSSALLRASSSSVPELRHSTLCSGISSTAQLPSPRRAHSAQPASSRVGPALPSPRRVTLPGPAKTSSSSDAKIFPSAGSVHSKHHLPVYSTPSTAKPVEVPLSISSTNSEAFSNHKATGDMPQATSQGVARRSQRSARPSRVNTTSASENVTLAPSASSVRSAATAPKSTLSAAQVQALTNKNTTANRKLYNKHSVAVVRKEENRPPSPTSRLRRIADEQAEASTSAEPKVSRNALATATKAMEASTPANESFDIGRKRSHFVAAGDDGVFESPVKVRKTSLSSKQKGDGHPAKTVKWDKDLLKVSDANCTPTKPAGTRAVRAARSCKNSQLELDHFGNVPDCRTSLSPHVPRATVDISKIIYLDDPEDDTDS